MEQRVPGTSHAAGPVSVRQFQPERPDSRLRWYPWAGSRSSIPIGCGTAAVQFRLP